MTTDTNSLHKIDLRKKMVIDLTKKKNIDINQKARVVLALDFSGSMSNHYASGYVQRALERIIPLALRFDDNGSLEVYIFDTKSNKLPDVDLKNFDGYVKKEIMEKYEMGGTNYSPVMENVFKNSYNGNDPAFTKGKGLFGKLFGGSKPETTMDPTYVIFITDGDNSDHGATERLIKEYSKHGIFWQFVGIGNPNNFDFLSKLDTMGGRYIDNANFFPLNDLDEISDEHLYEELLGEFPSWLELAKDKKVLTLS